MKKLLNTLYITTQGSYLHRDGETVEVRVERETRGRIPIHTLSEIICFGQVSCSPPLMGLCAERGVNLAFLSEHGRFWARVQGPVSGNILLRRAQYRAADDGETTRSLAEAQISAKIANSRGVLLRGAREARSDEDREALEGAAAQLANCLRQVGRQDNLDSLRGKEGEAARIYYGVFNRLIRAEGFEFSGRNRRPPRDPVNALLSFAYVLLSSQMVGALEGVGLDPAAGFLHRERPGRPSLALDMIEPMRAPLADRFVLSLINLRQVQPKGFSTTASGAVEMDEKTRKIFLTAWEERKHEELQHPFLGEKFSLGLLPHAQALLLARHLRGDLDAYPPYFWK